MQPDDKAAGKPELLGDDGSSPGGYASPACSAHEVDPNYMMAPPAIPQDELLALLNSMLEAERAGAKTIGFYMKGLPPGPARDALAAVGADEGRYVVLLRHLILRFGGVPSTATGSFFDKAQKIDNLRDRLAFLDRGQGWVARKLEEVLPRLRDAEARAALEEMRRTHVENIRRCGELAATL